MTYTIYNSVFIFIMLEYYTDPRHLMYLCCMCIILTILIIYILKNRTQHEHFSTQHQKAQAIYNWFMTHPNPQYIRYKRDLPDSDIVEYEDVRGLMNARQLSVEAVKKII
jgi:hypothetical protein